MRHRFTLSFLLQALTLFLLGPTCEASSQGFTVHVEPLDSSGGTMVRAHFTAIATSPCPDMSPLCTEGEDCQLHKASRPFIGTKPEPGWCVRQWQKTVPSDYSGTISLGSNTEIYVSMKTGPKVRANNGRLNRPAFVALPPPLRARVNCPHHHRVIARDLDGDKVRCRFAQEEQGECRDCTQHAFIELQEETCTLTFTGNAPAGQYFIYLMAEDVIPLPRKSLMMNMEPMSSVPVHLSLTVEESTISCSYEPVATGDTPEEDSVLFVLPYQEVAFSIEYIFEQESVSEVAVVGPPELFRIGFLTAGPLTLMTIAWVRAENNLTSLLPVCFAVNTNSMQSEPRCLWLYQREMRTLPAGTELTCERTEMTLVLPVTSLADINLAELQLNSPTCPVSYNSTYLTARISLTGCGTKAVHAGSELIYTNILQSVRPYTVVSRKPTLLLPLACRIPAALATGPHQQISIPTEVEIFGAVEFWIEIHFPGEGPLARFTRIPQFRTTNYSPGRLRRELPSLSVPTDTNSTGSAFRGAIGSRIDKLDLHLMSNCSIERAEMIVSNCIESETADFQNSHPVLNQGCSASNSTLEILTTTKTARVYRLDLSNMQSQGSMMYIRCTVNLCITTLPSESCPNLCSRSLDQRAVISSVFTKSYTITSEPISRVVTTAAPAVAATTRAATTKITNTNTDTDTNANTTPVQTTSSHAPVRARATAAGVILTTISIVLQNVLLH